MNTTRWFASALFFAGICQPAGAGAAPPPAPAAPATRPAGEDALSDRQASILLQLANAEVNIKVINQALARTGYQVGQAYDRMETAEKGNELMDRKGGGPVPWDQFYGKTARAFLAPAPGRGTHVTIKGGVNPWNDPIRRPKQFELIYNANNHQAAKARDQIAALAQNQAALLARRQKHEADQAALWAELSWEQVKDREIAFRPLYRFKLKGTSPARADLLRGPVRFLLSLDRAVTEGLESVEKDPAGTFAAVDRRAKSAYAALQESSATAMLAPGLTADDRKEAEAIKALCKEAAEQCAVIDNDYGKALDSDRAKEDASKLEYRQELQASLAKLAGTALELDERLGKAAQAWGAAPEVGVANPDLPPPDATPPPAPAVPAETKNNGTSASATNATTTGTTDLFDGKSLAGWEGDTRYWSVKDGVIHGKTTDNKADTDLFTKSEYKDFVLDLDFRFASGNSGVLFRAEPAGNFVLRGGYEADIYLPRAMGKLAFNDKTVSRPEEALQKKTYKPGDWNHYRIEATGEHVRIWLNGELMTDQSHQGPRSGRIGLQLQGRTEIEFRNVRVRESQ